MHAQGMASTREVRQGKFTFNFNGRGWSTRVVVLRKYQGTTHVRVRVRVRVTGVRYDRLSLFPSSIQKGKGLCRLIYQRVFKVSPNSSDKILGSLESSCPFLLHHVNRQPHDAAAGHLALHVVVAEVSENKCLHDLAQQYHDRPKAAAERTQQKRVAVEHLQEPVRAGEESSDTQREDVVRREALNRLLAAEHV